MRLYKGKYYYEFHDLVPKLISKQGGKCYICGSTENIEPHHLKKVKPGNSRYADENNIVIICERCHNQYHQKYNRKESGGINPKTFMQFKIDYDNKRIIKLVNERNMFKNKLHKTENELMELKKHEAELTKHTGNLFDESEYNNFVKSYNNYNISVNDIIRNIGNSKYRLFRSVALDSGDIVQRPKGLRFGY